MKGWSKHLFQLKSQHIIWSDQQLRRPREDPTKLINFYGNQKSTYAIADLTSLS